MFRKIILERFLECPQCLAAVRDLRLFFCRKLCKGLSLVRHEKDKKDKIVLPKAAKKTV